MGHPFFKKNILFRIIDLENFSSTYIFFSRKLTNFTLVFITWKSCRFRMKKIQFSTFNRFSFVKRIMLQKLLWPITPLWGTLITLPPWTKSCSIPFIQYLNWPAFSFKSIFFWWELYKREKARLAFLRWCRVRWGRIVSWQGPFGGGGSISSAW